MDTVIDYFKYFDDSGIHIGLIVAGMWGAFVNLEDTKQSSFWKKAATILAGGAIANYITPLIFILVNIPDSVQLGFAFIFGSSGIEGVKWIIVKLKGRYGKN